MHNLREKLTEKSEHDKIGLEEINFDELTSEMVDRYVKKAVIHEEG